jgi:hypothetical protein
VGLAPLTQIVTGYITRPPEFDTYLAQDTQSVKRGRNVSYDRTDECEERIALQTQIVNGDNGSKVEFGTATPISTQCVATGGVVANKENERERDCMIYEGLGTDMTDIGVATEGTGRGNETLSAGPDMNKTARTELNMNRPVDNKIKRLGIGETLATGLAKEINNDN